MLPLQTMMVSRISRYITCHYGAGISGGDQLGTAPCCEIDLLRRCDGPARSSCGRPGRPFSRFRPRSLSRRRARAPGSVAVDALAKGLGHVCLFWRPAQAGARRFDGSSSSWILHTHPPLPHGCRHAAASSPNILVAMQARPNGHASTHTWLQRRAPAICTHTPELQSAPVEQPARNAPTRGP